MELPTPAVVTETDPQAILRDRYSERDTIVICEQESYDSPKVYREIEAQQVEYAIDRRQALESRVSGFNAKVESVRQTILNALENEEIEDEVAQDIARTLGFDLSKSVEVVVNVEFTLTLSIPHGMEVDEAVEDLEFSVSGGYSGDVEIEHEDSSLSDWSEV